MNVSARVDYQHVGEMWFHTMQGEATPTIWQAFFGPGLTSDFSWAQRDSYDTIDARLSLGGENWDVTLWGRNLGDEEYLEEVIPAPEFGGSFIHPASLKSYGLELSYRF